MVTQLFMNQFKKTFDTTDKTDRYIVCGDFYIIFLYKLELLWQCSVDWEIFQTSSIYYECNVVSNIITNQFYKL